MNLAPGTGMAINQPSLDFEPSAARARQLDSGMRSGLASSLRHLHEQAHEVLSQDDDAFNLLLARIEAGPIRPEAFSYYFDTVIAIESEKYDEARNQWSTLLAIPAASDTLLITDLADPATDESAQRIVRFFIADTGAEFPVYPPRPNESKSCREFIAQAFDLMDRADPELAAEIRTLLRQIYLASGSDETKAMTFDGSSSFMMWGAILLNAKRAGGALELAQMLAHESAHGLLFGMTTEFPLTLNSDDDRYESPLRVDLRPMEGIYHATYVSARMYRSVSRLLDSGLLDADQTVQAKKDLEEDANYFRKGYATVQEHGVLTEVGKGLMDSAATAMSSIL